MLLAGKQFFFCFPVEANKSVFECSRGFLTLYLKYYFDLEFLISSF